MGKPGGSLPQLERRAQSPDNSSKLYVSPGERARCRRSQLHTKTIAQKLYVSPERAKCGFTFRRLKECSPYKSRKQFMNKKYSVPVHRLLIFLIVLSGIISFGQTVHAGFKPRVHRFADETRVFVNAYLVETEKGIVAIDATLTVSDGKALRANLEFLRKPLLAVLLTHDHPDHCNGLAELIGTDGVPVISTIGVDKAMKARYTPAGEEQGRAWLGEEWPKKRIFPSKTLKDGEFVTFGGVTFTVRDLGPGESPSDSYWLVEGEEKIAFIGDVVMNRVHAYLADGHSTQWLKNIDRLKTELKDVRMIYPGHGDPGSLEILDWQKSYLEMYREAVKSLANGQPKLTDDAKQKLVTKMEEFLPNKKGESFIVEGADAVAAELAGEQK
jgi:glyoxylase-like metal-dependent hydrolase (beta-lactamase superfamily II)